MKKSTIAVAVLVAAVAFCGCSVFKSACSKSLPGLVAAQSYSFEAAHAIDNATLAIESSNLNKELKAKAFASLAAAKAGLQAANKSLAAASTACSQPDVATVFEAFISSWYAVRKFLSLVGDNGVGYVEDPSVYTLFVGR